MQTDKFKVHSDWIESPLDGNSQTPALPSQWDRLWNRTASDLWPP